MRAKTEPSWERVYAYVRELVTSGQVAPGEFLEEEQISAAVGVSRTPVRDAFHRLEADRFIALLPRRGAVVRAVSAEELVQLFETRRVIEAHVVRRIAEEGLVVPEALDSLLAELSAPAAFADVRFQAEGDFRFHRGLLALLGNAVMLDVFDGLQLRQQRVATSAISAVRERLPVIHAQHAALLAALRARDADRSVLILREHLEPNVSVLAALTR